MTGKFFRSFCLSLRRSTRRRFVRKQRNSSPAFCNDVLLVADKIVSVPFQKKLSHYMATTTKRRQNGQRPVTIIFVAAVFFLLCAITTVTASTADLKQKKNYREARMLSSQSSGESTVPDKVSGDVDARVDCRVDGMFLVMNLGGDKSFTGRVYPKGFSKTPCAQLYSNNGSRITYEVPMNTCNTMVSDFENGTREYHNMIVVQHHQTLVTKKDRSYAVRCRYRASEQLLQAGVGVDNMEVDPVEATASAPIVEMSLLVDASRQAEFVNIGDPLTMQIQIPAQRMYGILVHSCVVRDGAGVGGLQVLYDERGCPVDPDIMGTLQYKDDLTRASVTFKAHKFPYTTSLYYECHVQFCLKPTGECDRLPTPPKCGRLDSVFTTPAASSSVPVSESTSSKAIDDNISRLVTNSESSTGASAASQTPASTTTFTTIKFQPSMLVKNQQNATPNNMRRGDPSRLPIKSSIDSKDELMMMDQPRPSVAVEDMLLPATTTTEQTVETPASKKPSYSTAKFASSMMKRPQIVVEEQQIEVQQIESSTSSSPSIPSSATTSTTTVRPVTTTKSATNLTTVAPLLRSRSLTAQQQSRMLMSSPDEDEQPAHEVIGFSSDVSFYPTSSTSPPPPPATTTARIVPTSSSTGYAALEPLTSSDMAVVDGRQVYVRKSRSIAFATLSPNSESNELDLDDDSSIFSMQRLRQQQQKRKLEASLGGEVMEFASKLAANAHSILYWQPQTLPHVETLIGYYDGARDDDYDLIRSRREVSNSSRVRRSSGTLTSSSSSIEVGRTAREAKVVRGLNVIDVSEAVPNYIMQAYKSQNGGQPPSGTTNADDSSSPPAAQLCLTTTTFAVGLSAVGLLCLLSAIVLGAAACSRCRRRPDDESEILGSECATAATSGLNSEIVSGHLASLYTNSALFAAHTAGYPTLTHGVTSCSTPYAPAGLMPHSPPPSSAMAPNADSHVYRYSSYAPKGPFSFS